MSFFSVDVGVYVCRPGMYLNMTVAHAKDVMEALSAVQMKALVSTPTVKMASGLNIFSNQYWISTLLQTLVTAEVQI